MTAGERRLPGEVEARGIEGGKVPPALPPAMPPSSQPSLAAFSCDSSAFYSRYAGVERARSEHMEMPAGRPAPLFLSPS